MKQHKEVVRIFDDFRHFSEPHDYVVFFKHGIARSVLSYNVKDSFLNGRLLEYAKISPVVALTDGCYFGKMERISEILFNPPKIRLTYKYYERKGR